jgi:hypothetical protein
MLKIECQLVSENRPHGNEDYFLTQQELADDLVEENGSSQRRDPPDRGIALEQPRLRMTRDCRNPSVMLRGRVCRAPNAKVRPALRHLRSS